jgi:hypothetical protein
MKVILSVPDEGYFERTWWRLFQKRKVQIKFDICFFYYKTLHIEKNDPWHLIKVDIDLEYCDHTHFQTRVSVVVVIIW